MGEGLPTRIDVAISQPLAEAVLRARRGAHPDADLDPLPPAVVPEAEAFHRRLGDELRATDPAVIVRWLLPLAGVVANSPRGEDLALRARNLAQALCDLPPVCWTPSTARSACLAFKYWPSAKEVADHVRPEMLVLVEQRAAVARLLAATGRRGSPTGRAETREERESWAERNRRTVEELQHLAAHREGAERPSKAVEPNVISRDLRIAKYRSLGQHDVADAIERFRNGPESSTV